jgi:hypothetical protein
VSRTGKRVGDRVLWWLAALMLVAVGAFGGCATTSTEIQRTTQGPTADDIWLARFVQGYGRAPTFDEEVAWKSAMETRILGYLSSRPELAVSPRASQFRFHRSVVSGMRKDEVLLLLEQPDAVTSDGAAIQTAAGRFWPAIENHAKEMWSYPLGWRLYFDGDVLSDLTVAGGSALH